MDFLPIFLNIRGRRCLVVGGGEVAARKAGLLRSAGAQVVMQSPTLGRVASEMQASGEIEHRAESYQPGALDGCALVVAATSDEAVNRRVHADATARNLPVNVVDRPELCSFIVPAIVDRSPVIAAVSSGGGSPVLSRLLRSRLESFIPSAYGRLAVLAERFRDRVKQRFADAGDRRRFWERVLDGHVAELALSGREAEAELALERELESGTAGEPRGEVYLVGAGPGDPDLLTFRALRLMQKADVVLYDRLVSPKIMALVRREAELIHVGKARSDHTMPQEEISALMAKLAKEGKRVLRLKGGDPFIFGRGGEEIEVLAEQQIPFQVVPGVTAAAGCAAYSGIPLTHRDYAQSVAFVTGHLKDNTLNLNWEGLIQPNQTIVIYMGLVGLDILCQELIARGMSPDTPTALVQQGTTPNHKVFIGTLSTMPDVAKRHEPKPPSLIIVGEVVKLHDKLNWYGSPAAR